MQSDHAGIAGQEADNLSGLSGRNLPAQSFLRSGLVTMIPAKLPKLPWFLHAGPILVVRRSGQTAQKCGGPQAQPSPFCPSTTTSSSSSSKPWSSRPQPHSV